MPDSLSAMSALAAMRLSVFRPIRVSPDLVPKRRTHPWSGCGAAAVREMGCTGRIGRRVLVIHAG